MHKIDKKCCSCNSAQIISGILFAVIAVMHLLRAALGWSVVIDGTEFPLWLSWVIVVIGTGAAGWNFCCLCCKRCVHQDTKVPPSKIT